MPDLTITLTDEDLARLTRMGADLGKNPRRVAESIVHRNLTKLGTAQPTSNRERAAERAFRQVELTRLLRRRRLASLGQADKRELAKRFGVTERTIYRDLIVVDRVLAKAREVPATSGQPEAVAS